MTDKPYGLDLFHKITDVHFASGNWLWVETFGAVNSFFPVTMQTDFTDQAGGTPGIKTYDGLTPTPAMHIIPFAQLPFGHLLPQLLKATIRTGAGSTLDGFGVSGDPAEFPVPDTSIYIRLDNKMPATTFGIKVTIQFQFDRGPSTAQDMVVKTLKATKGTTDPSKMDVASFKFASAPHLGAVRSFRINPHTLEVTGPF